MSGDAKVQDTNIAYDLYGTFQGYCLEYTYRGIVDSSVVENILSLAESSFGDVKEQLLVRKKVYFVMVECLQNITRHQEFADDPDFDQTGLFILRRSNNSYSVTSANLIKDDAIENLRTKIDIVNSKNAEELKEYARDVLSNGTFSNKGGAGLGLIEMARKAGSKFNYRFVPYKYGYSTFYLNIEIPIHKGDPVETDSKKVTDSIENYNALLKNYNVVLNFSGILNQTNLKNLLNILGRQINTSKMLKTKMHCIMIEMLQNILQHAYRLEGESDSQCYGMFYVRQDKEHMKLSSANHICNSEIKDLRELLDKIKNCDRNQRSEMQLNPDCKGQGFITIMNKSRHDYDYDFWKINNKYSLFAINSYLDKESEKDITM